MQMNKELYVQIETDDPVWDNQLVFSRAYCNQAKLSILVSHARTYTVGSLNVTLIQPRIELPVMHWCDYSSIRQNLLILQTPQSQPFLTCARVLRSWTTWELHLWESFPAAGLRRSALSRSIFPFTQSVSLSPLCFAECGVPQLTNWWQVSIMAEQLNHCAFRPQNVHFESQIIYVSNFIAAE